MRKLKLAVLISGGGTNLQALIDACNDPSYPAEIAVVVSNRPDAYGLERAKSAGISAECVDHKDYETREDFEDILHDRLKDHDVELVCLAGFMRLLTATFVGKWKDRMINIHPSLLPSYKGLHTHARAIEDGVRFGGCTVHFVRPEMDDGPIIMQAAVPIDANETEDSLAKKVLTYEHTLYPEAVRLVAEGKVRVSGQKCVFKDTDLGSVGLISPVPAN
ncbi:MAG: phosphoribosylglycinamide formyltransferase [Kordiimonadaceae bacterium]|nr:phosphoribosylglycinamide formyltransferase [Kordiimonadaceae bacterium]MBO6570185.1 phosphoribosylglycinamide formyltransferase [Kordiimonadaceae bacterium]MBO6965717.1 phosphoribosylglycinamide formyltransferase [Kordiimonadaceae bacterium]